MKIKTAMTIVLVAIAVAFLAFYGATSNHDDLYASESEYPTVSTRALMDSMYSSIEEMYADADVVAEIKIIDQSVEMVRETAAQTVSKAAITELYKGDRALQEMVIAEVGGPVDYGKVAINKPSTGQHQAKIVEQTVVGSPVMKKGNAYLVFLRKNQKSDTYSPLGGV